jgi:hypothetical protein
MKNREEEFRLREEEFERIKEQLELSCKELAK